MDHALRFPQPWRRHRLISRSAFDAVFKRGQRRTFGPLRWLVVFDLQEPAQLGLLVSRKAGNAVRRNRYKRQLRALFRAYFSDLPDHGLYVLQVLPALKPAPFAALRASFTSAIPWLRRLAGEATASHHVETP